MTNVYLVRLFNKNNEFYSPPWRHTIVLTGMDYTFSVQPKSRMTGHLKGKGGMNSVGR